MPMTEHQYEAVMNAIKEMDAKFSGALATSTATLNAAIVALTEMHHRALLEQERRNSGFATIEWVDERLGKIQDQITANRQLFMSGTAAEPSPLLTLTGYAVQALITGAAVILAFLLAHVRP